MYHGERANLPIREEQMQFEKLYFAAHSGQSFADPTWASGHSPLDKAKRDAIEDKIRQIIDSWTTEEQATAYWYLFASGMNLEKAKAIRRRAGFVS